MAFEDWLRDKLNPFGGGNRGQAPALPPAIANLPAPKMSPQTAAAIILKAAQSGGPSTGLGAPAPQTRWGDTIGSVNAQPGTPMPTYGPPDPPAASMPMPIQQPNIPQGMNIAQIDPVSQRLIDMRGTQTGITTSREKIVDEYGGNPVDLMDIVTRAPGVVGNAIIHPLDTAKTVGTGFMDVAGYAQHQVAIKQAELGYDRAKHKMSGDQSAVQAVTDEIKATLTDPAGIVLDTFGSSFAVWMDENPEKTVAATENGFDITDDQGNIIRHVEAGPEAVLAAFNDEKNFAQEMLMQTGTDPMMLTPLVGRAATGLKAVTAAEDAGAIARTGAKVANKAGEGLDVVTDAVNLADDIVAGAVKGTGKAIGAIPGVRSAVEWVTEPTIRTAAQITNEARERALKLAANAESLLGYRGASVADTAIAAAPNPAGFTPAGITPADVVPASPTAVEGKVVDTIGQFKIVERDTGEFVVVGADGNLASTMIFTNKQGAKIEAADLYRTAKAGGLGTDILTDTTVPENKLVGLDKPVGSTAVGDGTYDEALQRRLLNEDMAPTDPIDAITPATTVNPDATALTPENVVDTPAVPGATDPFADLKDEIADWEKTLIEEKTRPASQRGMPLAEIKKNLREAKAELKALEKEAGLTPAAVVEPAPTAPLEAAPTDVAPVNTAPETPAPWETAPPAEIVPPAPAVKKTPVMPDEDAGLGWLAPVDEAKYAERKAAGTLRAVDIVAHEVGPDRIDDAKAFYAVYEQIAPEAKMRIDGLDQAAKELRGKDRLLNREAKVVEEIKLAAESNAIFKEVFPDYPLPEYSYRYSDVSQFGKRALSPEEEAKAIFLKDFIPTNGRKPPGADDKAKRWWEAMHTGASDQVDDKFRGQASDSWNALIERALGPNDFDAASARSALRSIALDDDMIGNANVLMPASYANELKLRRAVMYDGVPPDTMPDLLNAVDGVPSPSTLEAAQQTVRQVQKAVDNGKKIVSISEIPPKGADTRFRATVTFDDGTTQEIFNTTKRVLAQQREELLALKSADAVLPTPVDAVPTAPVDAAASKYPKLIAGGTEPDIYSMSGVDYVDAGRGPNGEVWVTGADGKVRDVATGTVVPQGELRDAAGNTRVSMQTMDTVDGWLTPEVPSPSAATSDAPFKVKWEGNAPVIRARSGQREVVLERITDSKGGNIAFKQEAKWRARAYSGKVDSRGIRDGYDLAEGTLQDVKKAGADHLKKMNALDNPVPTAPIDTPPVAENPTIPTSAAPADTAPTAPVETAPVDPVVPEAPARPPLTDGTTPAQGVTPFPEPQSTPFPDDGFTPVTTVGGNRPAAPSINMKGMTNPANPPYVPPGSATSPAAMVSPPNLNDPLELAVRQGDITDEDFTLLNERVSFGGLWKKNADGVQELQGATDERLIDVFSAHLQEGMTPDQAIKATMKGLSPKMPVVRKNKIARAFAAMYNGATNFSREHLMFNALTGPRGIITDLLGDTFTQVTSGRIAEAVQSFNIKRAHGIYKDIRSGSFTALGLTDTGSTATRLGLVEPTFATDVIGTGIAEVTRTGEMGVNRFVQKVARGVGVNEEAAKRIGSLSGFLASEHLRDFRTAMDINRRWSLYGGEMARQVPVKRNGFFDTVRAVADNGADADGLIRALGDEFSPADVRRLGAEAGFDKGMTEHLAREWRRNVTEIDKLANADVSRIAFDFTASRADEALKKIFLFHTWQARAAPLYARNMLRNPALASAFGHISEDLARDCEGRVGSTCGYLQLWETGAGYALYINPTMLLSSALVNLEPNQWQDPDSSMLDRMLSKVPAMVNPMLQGIISGIGWSGIDAPDPLSTYTMRKTLGGILDYGRAHGWPGLEGDGFGDAYYAQLLGFPAKLRQAAEDWVKQKTDVDLIPWSTLPTSMDPHARDNEMVQSGIRDKVYADYDIPLSTSIDTLAEQYPDAFEALQTSLNNWQTGKADPYADEAFREYTEGKMLNQGTTAISPGGTRIRAQSQDTLTLDRDRQELLGNQAGRREAAGSLAIPRLDNPTSTNLEFGQAAVNAAPSDVGKRVNDGWNEIAFGDDPAAYIDQTGIIMGGSSTPVGRNATKDAATNARIAAMTDDERMALADEWVARIPGGSQILQEARDARAAVKLTQPQEAQYGEWAKGARTMGIPQFRETMVAGNPNYARYIEGYDAYAADLTAKGVTEFQTIDEYSISRNAYLAAQGVKANVYDDAPISTSSPENVPFNAAATAAATDTATAKAKDPVAALTSDIQQYNTDLALFNANLKTFTGDPNASLEGMNPDLRASVMWHLNQAGVSSPSMPASVERYRKWSGIQQANGKPMDVKSYLEFYGKLEAGLAGTGIDAGIVLDQILAGRDPFAGTGFSIAK